MTLYTFKTFKTIYHFPAMSQENRFIYSLYGNYGSKVARLAWWLFSHSSLFRWVNRVDIDNIEGSDLLMQLLGPDCVVGINMGTQGPDQKKSVLGYDTKTGHRFFAKLATKPRAMALCRNEIKVYQRLADTGLVPKVYEYRDEVDYVFLKCECIDGAHLHGQIDQLQVLEMLHTMRDYHYDDTSSTAEGLHTCFCHMDFCPWNMIDVQGTLRIIDWEMSAEQPWGFDLFTYLLQTHFLAVDTKTGAEVIADNEALINEYFGMPRAEWLPYLRAFLKWKIDFFSAGQYKPLLVRYTQTLNDLS